MNYRLFIARRYLHSRQHIPLVSIISAISMAGVAMGVAALIVVLSVMNGFYDVVRDLMVSVDPHVRIVSTTEEKLSQDEATEIVEQALGMPQVLSATPYVQGKALLVSVNQPDVNRVVIIRGVSENPMEERIVVGEFDTSENGMMMGFSLGQRMGLMPSTEASEALLFSAQGIAETLTRVFSPPTSRRFRVQGLYQIEETYDDTHVYIGIREAQRLFHMNQEVTGVELRVKNLEEADMVREHLETRDPKRLKIQTWYDLQRSLYDVMRLEKWGASLILILICIIAAFNIVGSLTMVVIEKRRDIGILQALGAPPRDIRNIFLLQGSLIGFLGTGIGFLVGLGIVLSQKHFEIIPLLGSESFIIETYPVSIQALDLALVAAVSFGLCLFAALYPASRAAKQDPSRTVGQEYA